MVHPPLLSLSSSQWFGAAATEARAKATAEGNWRGHAFAAGLYSELAGILTRGASAGKLDKPNPWTILPDQLVRQSTDVSQMYVEESDPAV